MSNNFAFLCTQGGIACDSYWLVLLSQVIFLIAASFVGWYTVRKYHQQIVQKPFFAILIIVSVVALAALWFIQGASLFVSPVIAIVGSPILLVFALHLVRTSRTSR